MIFLGKKTLDNFIDKLSQLVAIRVERIWLERELQRKIQIERSKHINEMVAEVRKQVDEICKPKDVGKPSIFDTAQPPKFSENQTTAQVVKLRKRKSGKRNYESADIIRQMLDKMTVGGSAFFDKSAHKVRTVQFICGQMKKRTGKVFATETRSKLTAVKRIK